MVVRRQRVSSPTWAAGPGNVFGFCRNSGRAAKTAKFGRFVRLSRRKPRRPTKFAQIRRNPGRNDRNRGRGFGFRGNSGRAAQNAKFGRFARFSPICPNFPDLPEFPRFARISPIWPNFPILPDFRPKPLADPPNLPNFGRKSWPSTHENLPNSAENPDRLPTKIYRISVVLAKFCRKSWPSTHEIWPKKFGRKS